MLQFLTEDGMGNEKVILPWRLLDVGTLRRHLHNM